MIMAASEGFNFGFFDTGTIGGVGDDGDDGIDLSIDVDSFFQILNEDSSPNLDSLSTDPFYPPSIDKTLECGSSIHSENQEGLFLQQVHGAVSENSADTVETLERNPCASPAEIALTEASNSSFDKSSFSSGVYQKPNFVETNNVHSDQDWFSAFDVSAGFPNQSLFDDTNYDFVLTNGQVSDIKGNIDGAQPPYLWSENKIALEAQAGNANMTPSEIPIYDFFDGKGPESILYGSHSVSAHDSSSSTTTDEASVEPFHWGQIGKLREKQAIEIKDVRNNELPRGFKCVSSNTSNETAPQDFSFVSGARSYLASGKPHHSIGSAGGPVLYHNLAVDKKPTNLHMFQESASYAKAVAMFDELFPKEEKKNVMVQRVHVKPVVFDGTQKASQASPLKVVEDEDGDDDDDVCIIDDMNQPRRVSPCSTSGNSLVTRQHPTITSQCSATVKSYHRMAVSGTKQKANDDRLIQALVQDLSQPKSEASPPDGSLTVSLLRHQRIALSWMVQKETTSVHCSGGILADDQGLGKTVSTIALVLTERSPSSRTLKGTDLGELETLDLDEEDESRKTAPVNCLETVLSNGRLSGGTLIVCPTSVLRQWADELHNKVTSQANLSVLVYHGSNRTKDPYEVAKYDVVLTTYSIVSMEVPKQPVVVKGGNDKRKPDADDASIMCSKKRKHPSTSDKKRSKRAIDNELLEARPLAKVRWFRVVLDEAQSIKNHRTQVAQACWGLRAKRRWCLSGTPIQNAVDDLYSYFRFLKYDPFCVYNSFCSMVKFPISRNPSSGYRKLQVVLKTIMLRRTKGTHLDGKPIITLPPKSVQLKKVQFSEEERDFYSKLEADSREQFQAYAESGTVKQNYVNILLLLLRLRQACDHPYLVQGYDSNSVLKSSIDVAKKLPREQQTRLLSFLEASLAICSICNDPPEDAVVSICGHVFCNQCISESLSGDDNQCPATNCKAQLRVSSVFSKATLKSCLSDQSCQDSSNISLDSESSDQRESVETQPSGHFDSSKLKAALEVLQSLSKPQVSVPSNAMEPDLANNASNDLVCNNSIVKEKAIVFSQWTRMLDLLEASLKEASIQYRRLDGTMSVAARDKAVRDFNTLPEVSVMIMSLKAASLGLNMVAANHVLLLDLWWNPTTEDQAIDRAHRIGQTRPVSVIRLTVKDTVEDRILALQQKKRELVASAFGEDETGTRQTRLTVDDLRYLFRA